MSDFAKVFQTENYGQLVLIMQGQDKTGKPEIRLFLQPPELGVCSIALSFSDDDDGWDKCESAFAGADLLLVEEMAKKVFDLMSHPQGEVVK